MTQEQELDGWMTTATFKPAYWRYLPPITKLPVAQD